MYDNNLLEILETECFTVRYDADRIRAYLTDYVYAEPTYIIRDNDELLAAVRDIVKYAYSGIEECIPPEYAQYLAE